MSYPRRQWQTPQGKGSVLPTEAVTNTTRQRQCLTVPRSWAGLQRAGHGEVPDARLQQHRKERQRLRARKALFWSTKRPAFLVAHRIPAPALPTPRTAAHHRRAVHMPVPPALTFEYGSRRVAQCIVGAVREGPAERREKRRDVIKRQRRRRRARRHRRRGWRAWARRRGRVRLATVKSDAAGGEASVLEHVRLGRLSVANTVGERSRNGGERGGRK